MKPQLKKLIIDFIFENEKEFQINNAVTQKFRHYIYNPDGNFLIGGDEVYEFIKDAIKLIIR
jgi:hypothetical protein